MSNISTGKTIGYFVLPGLLPRVKTLLFSGFEYLAFYIALTYALVKLIPPQHPCLKSANIGNYSIRQVLAIAANNMVFSWRTIDQLIVFFSILSGLMILIAYLVAMIMFIMVNPAIAGPFGGLLGGSPFETVNPTNDIAFMMMDRVFGVAGVFNSKVAAGALGPWPTPFHYGLQALFKFYSNGILFIATFVFLYHVVAIVLETNLTGSPFGRRFENVWIPIRLIAAIGLLIPIGSGLNSAQWIVLHAAKYGSGAATNGWIKFNQLTGETPLGGSGAVVARPQPPDYSGYIKELGLIRSCIRSYETYYGPPSSKTARSIPIADTIRPYAVKGSSTALDIYDFRQAHNNLDLHAELLKFYNNEDIRIVFGEYRDEYSSLSGRVKPLCGEIVIPVTSLRPEALFVQEGFLHATLHFIYPFMTRDNGSPGGSADLDQQFCADRRLYDLNGSNKIANAQVCFCDSNDDGQDDGAGDMTALGQCNKNVPYAYWQTIVEEAQNHMDWGMLAGYQYLTNQIPNIGSETDGNYTQTYYKNLDGKYATWLEKIRNKSDDEPVGITNEIMAMGWGGAGVWYNRIADLNGSLIGAAKAIPVVKSMPAIMNAVANTKNKTDANMMTGCGRYNPALAKGRNADTYLDTPDDGQMAHILYNACRYFGARETLAVSSQQRIVQQSGNPIINLMNVMFGTEPIFSFRENSETHPLAQLSAIGRALIDKAIMQYSLSLGVAAVGGLSSYFTDTEAAAQSISSAASLLSGAGTSLAMIGLIAGFMLYYLLPLMPFMYFFFAVARWVKTIFEAMVGVPLWALAHLSTNGEGLPGRSALNGYFLILEIFLRPILTIFGLLASLATFTALVLVLNMMFDVATANLAGHEKAVIASGDENIIANVRGGIDQFFYLIMYVIICYLMATSSFKMIDLIPDNVMRWIGAGVQTFAPSDNADEMVDQSSMRLSIGMGTLQGQLQSLPGNIQGGLKSLDDMTKPKPPAAGEQAPPAPPTPPAGGNAE